MSEKNIEIVIPPTSTQSFIDLEGISGVFNTPGSEFRVRFFSTIANSYENNPSQLLDELKPMRERLRINTIKNINQVLQRDLDDTRIAEGLVPYLLNLVNNNFQKNHIAFFPAILGVLIPRDYLTNNKTINANSKPEKYPSYSKSGDFIKYSSNKDEISWKLQILKQSNGQPSKFSILSIDKNLTEIIVLDGQHRSNAFRVVNEKFFTNSENKLYAPYYKKGMVYEKDFKSDLGVTLIWFEKVFPDHNASIEPDYINRKLFIDVNNNAKKITLSRQILLDDRDPSSIITNSFYSIMAEKYGFEAASSKLSLIHLGFDSNRELKERTKDCFLNVTNPELINIVFDWFFFSGRTMNVLSCYSVTTDQKVKFNAATLSELLPISRKLFDTYKDEEGENKKLINDSNKKDDVTQEFKETFFNAFHKILGSVKFIEPHFKATSIIQNNRNLKWTSVDKKNAWDNILLGGEGLYYSFKKMYLLNSSRTGLKDINDAINEIEREFEAERATLYKDNVSRVNTLFNSFYSVAFQVAIFMAFSDFAKFINKCNYKKASEIEKSAADFIERINGIDLGIWLSLFNDVRPHLWPGDTDPKKWPAYHKIILRLIQNKGEFFDTPKWYNSSPEARMFSIKFSSYLSAFLHQKYSGEERDKLDIDQFKVDHDAEIETWYNNSLGETIDVFKTHLKITKLMKCDFEAISESIIQSKGKI